MGYASSAATSISSPGTSVGAPCPGHPPPLGVALRPRAPADLDRPAGQIDDPDLRHGMPGVKVELGAAVQGERAVGDLDQEQHVGGLGWPER